MDFVCTWLTASSRVGRAPVVALGRRKSGPTWKKRRRAKAAHTREKRGTPGDNAKI